jgi:hypothetical protein
MSFIENGRFKGKTEEGNPYWTFDQHLVVAPGAFITIIGWIYYENTGEVSVPRTNKGQGRYFNHALASDKWMELLKAEAQEYFVAHGAQRPWEEPKRKGKKERDPENDTKREYQEYVKKHGN